KVWRRLAPRLWKLGLLTELDREAFKGFCEAVARREDASKLLAAGILIRGRDGPLVTNPAWRVWRGADTAVRRYAAEFGLTPAARAGIEIGERGGDDELASILS